MCYAIDKSHIDQLTPEQKEQLRELFPFKKGQQVMTGRTGKRYIIKRITKAGKIDTGSFKTFEHNAYPVLTESELIRCLARKESEFIIRAGQSMPFDEISWSVTIKQDTYESSFLINALWEAFKNVVLG